ncbi:hypothetical protein GCM10027592_27950 [Spirosoma flavus]
MEDKREDPAEAIQRSARSLLEERKEACCAWYELPAEEAWPGLDSLNKVPQRNTLN